MPADANEPRPGTSRNPEPGRASGYGSPGSPANDDEQKQIDELDAKVEDARRKAADFAKQVTVLGAQLGALKARRTDRKKAADAYGTAAKQAGADMEAVRPVVEQKLRMAEAGIGAQKEDVDRIAASVATAITEANDRATAAEGKARESALALADAETAEQAANDALAAVKQRPAAIAAQIKDARALVEQAAKAEDKNQTAAMYYLLTKARDVVAGIRIQSQDEYERDLRAAAGKADDTKMNAAGAKTQSSAARDEALGARKTADDAAKGAREEVLKQLAKLPVSEPTAAA